MKSVIFAVFILTFGTQSIAADHQSSGNFGGLKKGFLNQSPKSAPAQVAPHKEQPEQHFSESALVTFESMFDETQTPNLWGNPVFQSQKMRYEIYDIVNIKPTDEWVARMEENFNLLAQGTYTIPCESLDFFKSVLKLWVFFNNKYEYRRFMPNNLVPLKPEFYPFVMQNMVNWVIKAKFAYMAQLLGRGARAYRNRFITEQSDNLHGEFILHGTGWDVPEGFMPARIHYVRETLKNGDTAYRLIDQSQTNNKWVAIKGDYTLSYFSKGEIQYYQKSQTKEGKAYSLHIYSGMILDKDLRLVEQEGLVLVKGWLLPEDVQIFSYAKHPFLDEMFFFEQELFSPTSMSPMAEALVNSVGGIGKVQEKGFIFIPSHNDHLTATQTRFLLPILQELKQFLNTEHIEEKLLQIAWIDESITKLKTTLVDELMAEQDDAQKQVIIEEIVENDMKQQLADKSSTLVQEIEQKRKEIKETKTTNALEREKIFKREKKKLVNKVKQKKIQELDPQLLMSKRREKALAHVEEKYLKQASLKRSFSASDVHLLLGEMVEELSPLGVERTGQAHARGSHAAVEIRDIQSGHVTHLSVAARPQKTGYQAGTLKTIVKDMIGKVKKLYQ